MQLQNSKTKQNQRQEKGANNDKSRVVNWITEKGSSVLGKNKDVQRDLV